MLIHKKEYNIVSVYTLFPCSAMKPCPFLKDKILAFIDTETSGSTPGRDKIIEVGIVKVKNNKVIAKYNQLINPNRHINSFITQLTGIRNEDVKNAPTF